MKGDESELNKIWNEPAPKPIRLKSLYLGSWEIGNNMQTNKMWEKTYHVYYNSLLQAEAYFLPPNNPKLPLK